MFFFLAEEVEEEDDQSDDDDDQSDGGTGEAVDSDVDVVDEESSKYLDLLEAVVIALFLPAHLLIIILLFSRILSRLTLLDRGTIS